MKKHFAAVLAAGMLLAALTGCMAQENDIRFHPDASGTITGSRYLADSFITEMGYTPESMFAEDIALGAVPVKKTYDGEPYSGVTISMDFKNLDELNAAFISPDSGDAEPMTLSFTQQTQNGADYVVMSGRILPDNEISHFDDDPANYQGDPSDLMNVFRVTLTMEFPLGVTSVSGLEQNCYSINGNSITVNMVSKASDQNFFVTGCLSRGSTAPGLANFVPVSAYQNHFTDVTENDWFSDSVARDYSVGVIGGTSDTTYSPNDVLTRGQIITMASRIHAIYNGNGQSGQLFQEIPGFPWYQPYVEYAIQNGIIDPKAFGTYHEPATRAEMAYVLSRCLPEAELAAVVIPRDFDDVPTDSAYYANICTLYQAGITVGTGGNNFSPDAQLNRAQAAVFVDRLINPAFRSTGA